MKKEYVFVFSIGLLLLAYLLDAVVNPLTLKLTIPYQYFIPANLTKYAFTNVSILLKATAILLLPLLILSSLNLKSLVKGLILLVLSALLQLYAVQDIATGNNTVPLEWSLAFTLGGLFLLLPTVIFLLVGSLKHVGQKLAPEPEDPPKFKL